jgi:hypothetical protein
MYAVAIRWLWLAALHDGGVDRVDIFLLAVLDAKVSIPTTATHESK